MASFLLAFPPEARPFIDAVGRRQRSEAIAQSEWLASGVNTFGSEGQSALLLAVIQRDTAMVEALLAAGAHPDGGPDGAPVTAAVDDPALLKRLLQAGASPDGRGETRSALNTAALHGAAAAVTLLLEAGADISGGTPDGEPPLLTAAYADHWRVAEILLGHGARATLSPKRTAQLSYLASHCRLRPGHPDAEALTRILPDLVAG